MSNVTPIDPADRLRVKLVRAADTLCELAKLVEDPAKRAKLTDKATSIRTRAEAMA